jgi:MoaA/NifB/PqqE/SkfB family radical SAM enzyme
MGRPKGRSKAKDDKYIGPGTKKFLKNFVRNRLSKNKYPFFGSIEMTRRCNSKCTFCPIGSEKKELVEGEMTTAEIKHVLDQFAELNILAFTYLGGEPTLRSDVCEVADHAKELEIFSELTTNGLLLEKRAEEYTKSLDVIVVSLDTTDPAKYKKIRNVDAFDKVVGGIEKVVEYGKRNKCSIVTNTVICASNLDEVPEVVDYCQSLGVDGIMLDFATFHDYWTEIVDEKSTYRPDEMDWRKHDDKVKAVVPKLIEMKRKKYPIITSKAYLETFLTGDFQYRCFPYLFCCVDKDGRVAIPCWDHPRTKFFDVLKEHNLKDLWFSDEVKKEREKVKDCTMCYMHCIVEPSKVLGAPLHNLADLLEWIVTFRWAGAAVR